MSDSEAEDSDVNCLFCAKKFLNIQRCLIHMKVHHGFDFIRIQKDWGLDFYSGMKLINFIRSQTAKALCPFCKLFFDTQDRLFLHFDQSLTYPLPVPPSYCYKEKEEKEEIKEEEEEEVEEKEEDWTRANGSYVPLTESGLSYTSIDEFGKKFKSDTEENIKYDSDIFKGFTRCLDEGKSNDKIKEIEITTKDEKHLSTSFFNLLETQNASLQSNESRDEAKETDKQQTKQQAFEAPSFFGTENQQPSEKSNESTSSEDWLPKETPSQAACSNLSSLNEDLADEASNMSLEVKMAATLQNAVFPSSSHFSAPPETAEVDAIIKSFLDADDGEMLPYFALKQPTSKSKSTTPPSTRSTQQNLSTSFFSSSTSPSPSPPTKHSSSTASSSTSSFEQYNKLISHCAVHRNDPQWRNDMYLFSTIADDPLFSAIGLTDLNENETDKEAEDDEANDFSLEEEKKRLRQSKHQKEGKSLLSSEDTDSDTDEENESETQEDNYDKMEMKEGDLGGIPCLVISLPENEKTQNENSER
ncbi:uncharacterized protein MONOS_229 [Monocercomonoides exilis]|uniref:uncharacterized protein n=1 Tax=Monocercomonoides exilis TaxID=2049356 RepID=UPI003559B50B|nr:hypothetical protein MONOS_229 [Monocercomonoides exilis]|eukprot:MONOS_229.1-p1 / transcript=MONOS_229.1 / gene=MONOS_229 / organism=Monocercomonoides_exilis_PA203 / gene_product=unspecified product / transcript_product=unspecified product / location=Mono_scaffold00004:40457-42218(+) / protein_length=528 / sequence_SO=supercontig / SO=protein_coding / is_pseudo=false